MASTSSNIRALNKRRDGDTNVVKIDSATGMQTSIAKDATPEEFAASFSAHGNPAYQQPELSRDLDAETLKWMWTGGAIDTASYIALALWLEGDKHPLNCGDFADRWRGPVIPDTGKAKELKADQVEKVFINLKKNGQVQAQQLEIKFSLLY